MKAYYVGMYAKTGIKPSEKQLTSTKEVTLLCKIGWDSATNRTFANIKCPVNPLPVIGDFNIPSISVLERWLIETGGWTKVSDVPIP